MENKHVAHSREEDAMPAGFWETQRIYQRQVLDQFPNMVADFLNNLA